MAGEKTEKATAHKKNQERKKGNVFQSRDVVMVFSLLVMMFSLQLYAPQIFDTLKTTVINFIGKGETIEVINEQTLTELILEVIVTALLAIAPLLLISIVATIVATAAQTKMLFTWSSLEFKFDKLNPINGLKNMFSLRAFVELTKNILKLTILGIVAYFTLGDEINTIPNLIDMTIDQCLAFFGDLVVSLLFTLVAVFAVIAVFDYIYQRYDYEKKLRMSKDDIKEEYKQTEGDPQIKGRRKQKQMEMAQRRMMQSVPTADVIIRNPTHYAIAISYDSKKHAAPVVVAKGADYLALKIIETAEEHDVVITENKPLARSLYESVDLDHPIPESFYVAVAEVLAFVYSIKKKEFK